jgi:hypothetical protein
VPISFDTNGFEYRESVDLVGWIVPRTLDQITLWHDDGTPQLPRRWRTWPGCDMPSRCKRPTPAA